MRILELKDQIMFYDIEVFKYGWSIVFKNQGRKKRFVCKDDSGETNIELRRFLLNHPLRVDLELKSRSSMIGLSNMNNKVGHGKVLKPNKIESFVVSTLEMIYQLTFH